MKLYQLVFTNSDVAASFAEWLAKRLEVFGTDESVEIVLDSATHRTVQWLAPVEME